MLYLSFLKPQRAKGSDLLDNGIIVHTDATGTVGITILETSTHS